MGWAIETHRVMDNRYRRYDITSFVNVKMEKLITLVLHGYQYHMDKHKILMYSKARITSKTLQ